MLYNDLNLIPVCCTIKGPVCKLLVVGSFHTNRDK